MNEMPLRQNTHRKKRKRYGLLAIVLIFFIISAVIVFQMLPKPSEETLTYFTGENPILYEGEQTGNAIVQNGTIYMPLSFFESVAPDLFFQDSKSQSMLMTTKTDVIQLFENAEEIIINRERMTSEVPAVISVNGSQYINLQWLVNYYPIYFNHDQSGTLWISLEDQIIETGHVMGEGQSIHDLRLRSSDAIESAYYDEVTDGETVFIESETENYYLVRKANGVSGFIKKKFIDKNGEEVITITNPREQYSVEKLSNPIFLTWEAVYSRNPDTNLLPNMIGVNVVSPTWFHLQDEMGNLTNLASENYVEWAKEKGYKIWALFSNDFDPALTKAALANYEARTNIIDQLIQYSRVYQLDGINFDIENVNEEDGYLVTQLLREAAPLLHQEGLIVSLDMTFISNSGNWSKFYERDKLSEIVDYMMVMAYDEHTAGGKKAGSVSSLPWVEGNLQRLLEVVPAEKLVLGIPFYTRLWTETINESGETEVTAKALTMNQAANWVAERGLTTEYDDETGQNYVEYEDVDGTVYKMWLEDQTSLRKRADLARKYDLAGIATWARYFANDDAWAYLNEYYVLNQ